MDRLYLLYGLLACYVFASAAAADPCQSVQISYANAGTIPSIPTLNGTLFIGSAVEATHLKPKWNFEPQASLMHGDSGNSGSTDNPGPLGKSLNVTTANNQIDIMMWGPDGSLTAGYANGSTGTPPPRGIVALDPTTLQILAAWYPPAANETLGLAYMEYLQDTNDILLSTKQGHIYVVHRNNSCDGSPIFTTTRTIELSKVIQPWETLLNTMYDTAGNIWFSTGAIIGGGDEPQNSTTVGYVAPSGAVVVMRIEDQMVENGLAVCDSTVYMATGPSGAANTTNATGYLWAMEANDCGCGGVNVLWNVPYAAGAGGKPGELARGSGSTPTLLNDQFVTITDNEDPQINLNVYHQQTGELLCKVPLFEPGASNNDNGAVVHFDGETYGVLIQNNYNAPPVYLSGGTAGGEFAINGPWNNMSQMAGGASRIDVTSDGKCEVRWTVDLAIKAVSILSTKTGLVYSYIQDTTLSPSGEYVWYLAATDWATGEIVWKVRVGAGGTYNDNWFPATLGPDGMLYQAVLYGVVGVQDER